MRALVTGAAGFVGSRVAHALVQAGCEVHALVREPGERLAEIASAIHVERCDLTDPSAVDAIVARVRPELCLHCAWYAVPGSYLHSPENDRQRLAALALARSLAAYGCHRLVGVGTCFEYAGSNAPIAETSPVAPATPYALSKLATFRELERQCAASGLGFAWARLFHLYGPFEDHRRLVPAVTLSLLEHRPAKTTLGEQRRDFLHVDDVAGALLAIGLSDLTGPVNVGSGESIAVRDIVLHLGALAGRPDLIELGALEQIPGDPAVLVAENRLLVGTTGWAPRYTLEEGLGETVAWWRARVVV